MRANQKRGIMQIRQGISPLPPDAVMPPDFSEGIDLADQACGPCRFAPPTIAGVL